MFKLGDKVRIKDGSFFGLKSNGFRQGYGKNDEKLLGIIVGLGTISGFAYSVNWTYDNNCKSSLDYGYNVEDLELDELYQTKLAKLL